ncbi:protein FAR1-RELATED SEQUENCE 11-like [Panicum miliaceum]|uniref:Protein FAR1-RELATED SEQUENCE 11-like n=1 Tax=Panicum miliaceum TaxID=4540 RepID=A0A3L6RHU1_PANMI|nr:protein FAR1-RELATED SEQUENCE 11-like [Panicum miliaceum]
MPRRRDPPRFPGVGSRGCGWGLHGGVQNSVVRTGGGTYTAVEITMPTGAATAPAAIADAPGANQSLGSADPLHHTTTLTPPATLLPGALRTLDIEQIIYPDPNIAPLFLPRVRQVFLSMNDAYVFYKDYAKIAGFSLRTARTSKKTSHWVCSREGWHESKKGEVPNKTEKGSKRCCCPAYVKVKEDKKQKMWYFDHVQEAHNHKLEPSPRMTRYMHAHKNMEEGMCDIFNIMTRNGVAHQAALNVMADMYDGRHMWGFTEKDVKNMKAEKARVERDDDLNKLLQFFRDCKANNEYFY